MSVHGRDVSWADAPAHYVVYAWTGDRLLFYRIGLGEKTELLVADAPGKIRSLAEGTEIAASPDVPPAKGSGGVSFLLECDRVARTCERTDPAPAKDWLRQVDDTAAEEGGQ